jgi:N-acetylglucosamine kinase-like BadF-type ATPase
VRGIGISGASNYDDVGAEGAQTSIAAAVRYARERAGMPAQRFDAVFMGMAGVVSNTDRAVFRQIVQKLDLAEIGAVGIDHDIHIALAGALSGRPGIVVIAGTGSACYARSAGGVSWRSGGWGSLLADEGSGYWFGVEAIKAAVRASDGRGATTVLTKAVLDHLKLSDINDIMHRLYSVGMSRSEIAAMSRLVIEAARAQDRVAIDLISQAGDDLAACVEAAARAIEIPAPEVAVVGGMTQAGAVFLEPLQMHLRSRLPDYRWTTPELSPVLGAGLLALERLAIVIDSSILQNLRTFFANEQR